MGVGEVVQGQQLTSEYAIDRKEGMLCDAARRLFGIEAGALECLKLPSCLSCVHALLQQICEARIALIRYVTCMGLIFRSHSSGVFVCKTALSLPMGKAW